MTEVTGRCLCGIVRYAFDADAVLWRGHCHCDSCRRATGAPLVTWFGVQKDGWRWTAVPPQSYQSSSWAERFFCANCGAAMGYRSDKLPDEFHGLAVSLDDPADFAPGAHFFTSHRLPWLHVADDLPRYLDGGKTLERPDRSG